MILYPPCKINLGLHILHKRNDGYHELDTCMYEIPMFDILEAIPSEEFEFSFSGMEIPGNIETNLCVKAFNLLKDKHGIGNVKMHLHKQIPMGGGLGGGSSDGTYALLMLNSIFKLNLTKNKLIEYASELGSDCAFFVESGAKIARGRGEILKPINLNIRGYFLKIVNIGIHISTAEAYGNVEFQDHKQNVEAVLGLNLDKWKSNLKNDFEVHIFKKHPILTTIKERLYEEGAVYASMSGSGSTMFGIYKEKPLDNSFNDLNTTYEIILNL
jgi:4-diphosphocytidyl-2-C-methyl-D-erythritol kinase